MKRKILYINGKSLTLKKIDFFLKENPVVKLTAEAEKKVKRARALIDKWVETDEIIYGVTTGFGEFANVKISNKNLRSEEHTSELQSH